MFLGAKAIQQGLRKGSIIIDPFQESCLQTNSYDLHLGKYFIRTKEYPYILDLTSKSKIPIDVLFSDMEQASFCVIAPQEFILAQTEEYFGTTKDLSVLLRSRSTFARIGIDICASAGLGDIGFVSHWTLEIINHSPWIIKLDAGMRVAQACFIEVNGSDPDRRYNGSYLDNRRLNILPANSIPGRNFETASMLPDLRKEKLL